MIKCKKLRYRNTVKYFKFYKLNSPSNIKTSYQFRKPLIKTRD
jgi:hypothetical protein